MTQFQQWLGRAGGVLLLAAFLARPAHAGELDKLDSSLKLVPQDAAFYTAMLRNREQIEMIGSSNAWKKLWNLPVVQMGWKHLMTEYRGEGNFKPIRDFYAQEANRELMHLLADGLSHEIFCYGNRDFGGLYQLLMHVNNSMSFTPIKLQLQGRPFANPNDMMYYIVMRALADKVDLIHVPDLVVGMKITDPKKAQAQLDRLEKLLQGFVQNAPPEIRQRLKRQQIGGGDFITLTLDGSLVPWNDLPLVNFEQKPGEFGPLLRRLQTVQISLAVGVRDNYLLAAIGSTPDTVAKLGKGKPLADRDEFKPLARYTDRKLTSIDYLSKDFLETLGSTSFGQLDNLVEMAELGLQASPIPEAKQQAIVKDLKALVESIRKAQPQYGATVSFSFLTDRGSEGYTYDYTENTSLDGSKPLTLLNHLGGQPILAVVSRTKSCLETYNSMVKWGKIAYGHVDDLIKMNAPPDGVQQYERFKEDFLPLLAQLDKTTREMFLPALADGQIGIVLDAKWTSKRWHQEIPLTEQAMPLPEIGLLHGVSDAELLVKAMAEYRNTINQGINKIRNLAPPGEVPPFQLPPPQMEKEGDISLYYYPIPAEAGFDRQFQPTAGLTKDALALTLSRGHTTRLLKSQPLSIDSVPLGDPSRKLCGAAIFHFRGFVEAATPWVDLAAGQLIKDHLGPDAPEDRVKEAMAQVHTVLEVLKCFHNATSASWVENGVTITHTEIRVQDLKE